MNDSIIHTFHSWFNKEYVTSFSLSPTELIFDIKVNTSSKESNIIRKLNVTFLYAKYYLYNQKLIHAELSVNEFTVNLKHKYIFVDMNCKVLVSEQIIIHVNPLIA